MLIKATRVRTSSGSARLANHLHRGDDNEEVISVRGEIRDLEDAVEDARRFGRVYALRHFVIAPAEPTTHEQFEQVVALLGQEFGFDSERVLIREHRKARADGTSFDRHWHCVVAEVDPATGRSLSSSHDFQRHEKVARVAEFMFGHNPLLGAHHTSVLIALRGDGRTDVAEWLARAFPESGDRPREAFSTATHQGLKRAGLDASIAKQNVRAAWESTVDGPALHARFAEHGLRLRRGDRTWIVETVNGRFVGRATTMVGARKRDIEERMESTNDGNDPKLPGADPSGESDLRRGERQPDGGRATGAAPAIDRGERERLGRLCFGVQF